ncbi:MAG TPA: asparagine synthase-related protein [Arenimonas sp.]|nr:asparagine synthase-related protein [Arenimonas sp.]
MTIIAGCFCIDVNKQISDSLKLSLKKNLRRKEDGRGQTFSSEGSAFFLVKWDSGAFKEMAWIEKPDGSVSAMAGDPLALNFDSRISRMDELKNIDLFADNCVEQLINARGSFCLASYSSAERCLKLATDVIGLRSVYYLIQDGIFIFASTLRILEAIESIKKSISVIGVAEQCIYGQPLGFRSPYENIYILREAELLTVSGSGIKISRYFDWSNCLSYTGNDEEAAKTLHKVFVDSVRHRAIAHENTLAFLSGGMDSRAIVATLIECGHRVLALNFSPDNSQDKKYAERFAEKAGSSCKLFCYPRNADPNFSLLAYSAKKTALECNDLGIERPDLIWSGDGGSVGLGHVYMNEHMVDIIENEGVENVVRYFTKLHRHYLPVGVLSKKWRKRLPKMIFQDVLEEFSRYPRNDSGRQIYFFLLFNDQRRHLHKHFESIDEHGIEFLTPFFDSVFLRTVVSTPVRWGVLHRLYVQWFMQLPPFAQLTPWQTYPGHVKCPLQDDDKLSYQWDSPSQPSERVLERLSVAQELLAFLSMPVTRELFSKTRIVLAAVLHVFAIRDARYTLETLKRISHFDKNYRQIVTQ